GLQAISTIIGNPIEKREGPPNIPMIGNQNGKAYYFLWSLERVAVALSHETIGKKDWYSWGAQILVHNQAPDGTWNGDYPAAGCDTAFALLFLRRANLARDLSVSLKGRVQDPGEVVLKVGGVGGEGLTGKPSGLKSPFDPNVKQEAHKSDPPKTKPAPLVATVEDDATKQSRALVPAEGARQDQMLAKLRDTKGGVYTDALTNAIHLLNGPGKRKAREALAERCSRLTVETLGKYLEDEDLEIRRAAVLALAMRESKAHVMKMIDLLEDPELPVQRAALAALKDLTGQDHGPAEDATRAERTKAVAAWKTWWKSQQK